MPLTVLFAGVQRKVMTYNAMNLNNGKKRASMEALAEVIRREDPDILALHEVESAAILEELNADYLDDRYPLIVFPPQHEGGNQRLAYMCKPGIRVLASDAHLREQNTGAFRGKRGFLEAIFETDTGYRFRVFNAHFRARKPTAEVAQAIRVEEATSAAAILQALLKRNPRECFLVVGDFNSFPDTPEGQQVLDILSLRTDRDHANDLTEALEAVRAREGQREPMVTTRNGNWLDRMFASPGLWKDVLTAYVVGDIEAWPWQLASDHLPVVTVIEEPDALPRVNRRREALDVTA